MMAKLFLNRFLISTKSSIAVVFSVLLGFSTSSLGEDGNYTDIEQYRTCKKDAWLLTESFILRQWASVSRGHQTEELEIFIKNLQRSKNIDDYSITTSDNRVIRGRKLTFNPSRSETAVIIATGNVSIADRILQRLTSTAQATKFDFYFLDYRGYGRSNPANPSFKAFVSDFSEAKKDIKNKGYERIIGYGPSLGGIILLNAAKFEPKFDRLVVDSIQTDLTNYKCEESVFPINAVKSSCPNIVAITAIHDKEIKPSEQKTFLDFVQSDQCGGTVKELKISEHALNDELESPGDSERLTKLIEALAEKR